MPVIVSFQILEQEKQERIQNVHEQCLKINDSVIKLREQEALRQSQAGTSQVKAMSRKQIREEICKVQSGMDKLHKMDKTEDGPGYPSLTQGIQW